jgi:cell filamentation protein
MGCIALGDRDGPQLAGPVPQHIESYARNVFGELAREHHLVGVGHEAFIARLAHHLANVNALHPFRDGNGRARRAFFCQLAREAGYRLDWQRTDHQRKPRRIGRRDARR